MFGMLLFSRQMNDPNIPREAKLIAIAIAIVSLGGLLIVGFWGW